MKKSTKLTYFWHRAVMTIFFVVGLVGFLFNKDTSIKSEYLFVCTQSACFLFVSFLPYFIKKHDLDIPDFIYIIFILFCVAHFLCGEILDFYVKVKWWDSFLHTFSGMFIALLSFSLINILNKNSNNFKLNIVFASIFAFSLTVSIGAIWEIIEYFSDCIFNTNMQRAYVSTTSGRGIAFVGQEALSDTMKDLILDAIGAGLMCLICSIAILKNKIKMEDLSFIKKKKKVVEMTQENIENLESKINSYNQNLDQSTDYSTPKTNDF